MISAALKKAEDLDLSWLLDAMEETPPLDPDRDRDLLSGDFDTTDR